MYKALVFLVSSLMFGFNPSSVYPMLMAEVRMAKDQYVQGEPIEIRVEISNQSPEERQIVINYPTFQALGSSGISFTMNGENLKARRLRMEDLSLDDSGRMPIVRIAPKQNWATTIYLQRYTESLPPGRYQISYTLEIPQYSKQPEANGAFVRAQGNLFFTIEAGRAGELIEILKQYSAKLESQDFWEQRAAIEALTLVDLPLVVPHLIGMLKLGQADYGLKALARFPENEEAQSAVIMSLTSKQASAATQALKVLAEWGYQLKVPVVQSLLKRDDAQIRRATLRYVKAIKSQDYLEVIKPYLNDPSPDVAKEAQEALSILQKPHS